jgi:hypothetical protein
MGAEVHGTAYERNYGRIVPWRFYRVDLADRQVPNAQGEAKAQKVIDREHVVDESIRIGVGHFGLKLMTGLSARFKKGNCCQREEDEGFLCCSGLVEQCCDSCPSLLGRESGDAG